MKGKQRNLYEAMWGNREFLFPVEKTKVPGGYSNNSYSLIGASSTDMNVCCQRIMELFSIEDKGLFREKFVQSCSGSGQELKRIATVHSSSLCALLFFYRVTPEHPLAICLEGEKCIFDFSCFEYQNTVIEGRNPSNMDVVLAGQNESGRPVVLFLESKFSEYYMRTGRKLEIAEEYLDNRFGRRLYTESIMGQLGFEIEHPVPGGKTFGLVSRDTCYIEGIKQMISHYIGVRNLYERIQRDTSNKDIIGKNIVEKIRAGAPIYLGEILFDKKIGKLIIGNKKSCFDSYREKYMILSGLLNGQLQEDGMLGHMVLLQDLLQYSIFENTNYRLEEAIRKFYDI